MNNKKPAAKVIRPTSTGRPRLFMRLRGLFPRNVWFAWGMLIASLIVTALLSLYIKTGAEMAAARREFTFICNEIELNIANRLAASAQLLYSGAGLFDVSETDTVTRREWQDYTAHLQIEKRLPGIQGVGFALLIPPDQLDQHTQEMRSEGFPDYAIKPASQRDIYSSIIYLEPFTGRNLRAFGFDMLSEPVRRAAMEQARDENIAVLSGKVTLVQETNQDVQAGALMYVPVYHHALPIDTLEQRRAALLGWVYSPYRMTDMMSGTLGSWNILYVDRQISLQVYDGDVVAPATLLYDSQANVGQASASPALFSRLIPVDVARHRWTLRFSWLGGLATAADYSSVWLALCGGLGVSLLLFGLVISVLRTDVTAHRIADRLTMELRESEARYRSMIELSPNAIVIHRNGVILYVNPAAVTMYGAAAAQEMIGSRVLDRVHPDYHQSVLARVKNTLENSASAPLIGMKHVKLDGTLIDVEIQGTMITFDGAPAIQATIQDVTERKQVETALRISEERISEVLENSTDASYKRNLLTNAYEYWSPVIERISGYTPEEILRLMANPGPDMIHPDDQAEILRVLAESEAGANGASYQLEYRFRHKDGQYRWLQDKFTLLRSDDGTSLARIGTMSDITERRRMVETLQALATTDTLTGIANRRHFMAQAANERSRALRLKHPFAIAVIDIDRLKGINDTYGHAAGDLALVTFTMVCKSYIRDIDVMGRLGGDEFGLLLPETTREEAFRVMGRVQAALKAHPLEFGNQPYVVTISAGVAGMADEVESLDALLASADMALYRAKEAGRNRVAM